MAGVSILGIRRRQVFGPASRQRWPAGSTNVGQACPECSRRECPAHTRTLPRFPGRTKSRSRPRMACSRGAAQRSPRRMFKMKNRAVVALFVAFLLSLPALAQQPASSNSTDQSSQAASSSNTGSSATGKAPLQYESRQGFWGKVNPFARKKYVQKQTQPIRDRVNELDELTAANSKMIKDVDSRAQQGIQMASAKANEADQHAVDAGNKATQAQTTATQANTRLTTVEGVVSNIDQYKATNQTEIRFRPGQTVLSKAAKSALDDIANPLKGQRGYIVEVQGFSSGKGQAA